MKKMGSSVLSKVLSLGSRRTSTSKILALKVPGVSQAHEGQAEESAL